MNSYFSRYALPQTVLQPSEAYLRTTLGNYTFGLHSHGFLEINYVLDNYCTYSIQNQKYNLRKNDLILFNSQLPHSMEFLSSSERGHYSIAGVSFDLADSLPGTLPLLSLVQNSPLLQSFTREFSDVLVFHKAEGALHALRDVILYSQQILPDRVYLNTLINKLLLEIAQLTRNSADSRSDYISAVQDYIRNNFVTIDGIDEIAGYVCLNKNYIQRIFKAQVGCTIWQYVTNVRMQHAAALLRDTDIFISDIDKSVGIHSRQNFYTLFRKAYDMSPAEYRRVSRKGALEKRPDSRDLPGRFPCYPA